MFLEAVTPSGKSRRLVITSGPISRWAGNRHTGQRGRLARVLDVFTGESSRAPSGASNQS